VVFVVDDDIDVLCWIIQLAMSNRTPCPKLRDCRGTASAIPAHSASPPVKVAVSFALGFADLLGVAPTCWVEAIATVGVGRGLRIGHPCSVFSATKDLANAAANFQLPFRS